jgi:hypothetical protein
MERRLAGLLDEDEKLLWLRKPSDSGHGGAVLAVRLVGHMLLTLMSVGLALSISTGATTRVVVGLLFCAASNAPLIAWAGMRKRARAGGGTYLYFVTDLRAGSVSESGEFRQVPLIPALEVSLVAATIEFALPDQGSIYFAGLSASEQRLVMELVKSALAAAHHARPH